MNLNKEKYELVIKENQSEICHASTVLPLENGKILCAWFGGSSEGEKDVKIWMSMKENENWSIPFIVADEADVHWNPVLFQTEENEVILFYKLGKDIKKWQTMIKRSFDNGKTFEEAKELVKEDFGGRGPVRNKPILLSNGDILAPASLENGIWSAFVDISTDNCKNWRKSNEIIIENLKVNSSERTVSETETDIPVSEQSFYGRGVIQPTLWESENRKVHMLLRSSEGNIYRSDSTDNGRTWKNAYKTELPNNNSGIDLVKVRKDTLVLIYNPVGKNWGERTPISLAVSEDNGKTWIKKIDLETEKGEFSYPAIVCKNKNIFITYTWKRKNIAFWQFLID